MFTPISPSGQLHEKSLHHQPRFGQFLRRDSVVYAELTRLRVSIDRWLTMDLDSFPLDIDDPVLCYAMTSVQRSLGALIKRESAVGYFDE